MATNASNLQKHSQLVLLVDSLRKQSTIGSHVIIAFFLIKYISE